MRMLFVGGAAGCMGENFPPLTDLRIVHQCSQCPYWVVICVIGGFVISSVNGDIKGP